jgi:hypothetical protein
MGAFASSEHKLELLDSSPISLDKVRQCKILFSLSSGHSIVAVERHSPPKAGTQLRDFYLIAVSTGTRPVTPSTENSA